jgi:hypothetical protein
MVVSARKPCVSGSFQMAIQNGKLPTVHNQTVKTASKVVGCQAERAEISFMGAVTR